MTRALITMSAGLLAACGTTAAPPPAPPPAAPAANARPTSLSEAPPAEPDPPSVAEADPVESADAADRRVIAELERALELYDAFISRAGDDAVYADAVARSRARISDIRDTLIFLEQGMIKRQR